MTNRRIARIAFMVGIRLGYTAREFTIAAAIWAGVMATLGALYVVARFFWVPA